MSADRTVANESQTMSGTTNALATMLAALAFERGHRYEKGEY
jgi:hypothetical protein